MRTGKETPLFAPFVHNKCIILPRQARDKHRESTQKRVAWLRFVRGGCIEFAEFAEWYERQEMSAQHEVRFYFRSFSILFLPFLCFVCCLIPILRSKRDTRISFCLTMLTSLGLINLENMY
eukprot:COSAG06_NODE_2735_length_6368_cov_19.977987_7_plen_121_part_00